MNDRLLTTRQVADLVGCSQDTILRRCRSGQLPGYRLASNALRFDIRDVDAWLEKLRAGDAPRGVSATPDATRREDGNLPRSATPRRCVAAQTEGDVGVAAVVLTLRMLADVFLDRHEALRSPRTTMPAKQSRR